MKTNSIKTQKKIISAMLFAIALSFGMYSYAIASTTFFACNIEEKSSQIQDLETDIAELEIEYFAMIDDLSSTDVSSFGLQEISHVGYASLEKNTVVAYSL